MLRMMSVERRDVAASTERPRPVQSAMYAAKQMGHLGISARIALGTPHWMHDHARRDARKSADGGADLRSSRVQQH
jgi:hypothetical protein